MARTLPLKDSGQELVQDLAPIAEAAGHATGTDLTGAVAVFDPALCCATGVCGPGVDPALLTIARDLRWLESKGVAVTRAGLSQEPQSFVANPKVAGLLQAFGDGALPAVLVNGAVLMYGRYPSRSELMAALTNATSSPVSAASCGVPGSGCC